MPESTGVGPVSGTPSSSTAMGAAVPSSASLPVPVPASPSTAKSDGSGGGGGSFGMTATPPMPGRVTPSLGPAVGAGTGTAPWATGAPFHPTGYPYGTGGAGYSYPTGLERAANGNGTYCNSTAPPGSIGTSTTTLPCPSESGGSAPPVGGNFASGAGRGRGAVRWVLRGLVVGAAVVGGVVV